MKNKCKALLYTYNYIHSIIVKIQSKLLNNIFGKKIYLLEVESEGDVDRNILTRRLQSPA